MWISDTAIKGPVITLVSMLALVVFGLAALFQLDLDEFPEVNPGVVAVAIPYPGASPDVVEREVIDPIEEVISGISGLDRMQSNSLDGFGTIIAQFIFAKDMQEAAQEIRDEISGIRNQLPPEIEEPILTRFSPTDQPIMSLSLASPGLTGPELTQLADPGITRRLRSLAGVAQVDVVGGVERELTVELRPRDLEALEVSIGDVALALQTQNLSAPVGRLSGELDERTIRLLGRLDTPADFARVVVSETDGRVVRLGDVADVRDGTEEPRSASLFNEEPAVGINVLKSSGFSTSAVADAIRTEVEAIQPTLPPGVTLRIVRDTGIAVDTSVANVRNALLEGAALTVFVVFLFLNSWRSTVITGLALPVSVLASFISVWAFGFTLNTMSLMGLSLAIGILIDDAIVVRENIVRHVEMGNSHYRASFIGTNEIGRAVTATTMSIIVVFIPIAFMGGLPGQFFMPFGLTIAAAVLVSLFVSFSLDPMLSAYWPDPPTPIAQRAWVSRVLYRFNQWFDRQADNYTKVIGWALRRRLAMVLLALVAFGGALAMPAVGIVGSAATPDSDAAEFFIQMETPPGSNVEYSRRQAVEISRVARQRPEVLYTFTTVGGQGGAVDEGQVYVKLSRRSERERHQSEIVADIRRELTQLNGVTASIATGFNGDQKAIQLQLQGPDADVLANLADRIAAEMRQVPGAVDVGLSTRGQKPELNVELDRGLAGALGVTVGQVAQALRPAFAGIDVGDWIDPSGETRDVTIRLRPESRTRVQDLEALPLVLGGGPDGPVTIPLGQVARLVPSVGPAQIDHLDSERVVTIEANVEGLALSEVVSSIMAQVDEAVELPLGYTLRQGGETEQQAEIFGQTALALGIALLLMYFVLVLQFGSFVDPLPILFSLPLSLIGVVLALLLTGNTLNLMSMMGVMLLMGIVAKNAILLIDFAKVLQERGLSRREAIIQAGRVRLRPIIMTSFALIAGMVPVSLGIGEGADFRAPLGITVIGGLITSTLLTLLVIPTFYDIMAGWRDALARVVGGASGHAAGPAAAMLTRQAE